MNSELKMKRYTVSKGAYGSAFLAFLITTFFFIINAQEYTETIINTCPGSSTGSIILELSEYQTALYLNPSGQYNFTWTGPEGVDVSMFNGALNLDNLPAGEYYAAVHSNAGCQGGKSFTIEELDCKGCLPILAGPEIQHATNNSNGSISFETMSSLSDFGFNDYTFQWINTDTGQTIDGNGTHNYSLLPGCYSLVVTNDGSCVAEYGPHCIDFCNELELTLVGQDACPEQGGSINVNIVLDGVVYDELKPDQNLIIKDNNDVVVGTNMLMLEDLTVGVYSATLVYGATGACVIDAELEISSGNDCPPDDDPVDNDKDCEYLVATASISSHTCPDLHSGSIDLSFSGFICDESPIVVNLTGSETQSIELFPLDINDDIGTDPDGTPYGVEGQYYLPSHAFFGLGAGVYYISFSTYQGDCISEKEECPVTLGPYTIDETNEMTMEVVEAGSSFSFALETSCGGELIDTSPVWITHNPSGTDLGINEHFGCSNEIQDGDETDIDCGGSCYPCDCYDGVLNNDEIGIDCGGSCMPCGCLNGIQDDFETGVDCGGPCPPCSCSDGIMNGNEFGVDCGGLFCDDVCPGCDDGVQNNNETGVDCGGNCAPCSDGNSNNGTTIINGGPNFQPSAPAVTMTFDDCSVSVTPYHCCPCKIKEVLVDNEVVAENVNGTPYTPSGEQSADQEITFPDPNDAPTCISTSSTIYRNSCKYSTTCGTVEYVTIANCKSTLTSCEGCNVVGKLESTTVDLYKSDDSLIVFPNPFTHSFSVSLDFGSNPINLEMYDLQGIRIPIVKESFSSTRIEISPELKALNSGVYILRIELANGKVLASKVIGP